MNKEQIIEELKSINYPGFSRDIVSFGMVKDILINNNHIEINLNITSQSKEKKQIVVDSVRECVQKHFSTVDIKIAEQSRKSPQPQIVNKEVSFLQDVKNIIAVASGKGGVGKSTIAANLACALAKKGLKTGLLDLDIYGPSLPIIFDINKQPLMSDNKLVPIEKHGVQAMSFGFISGNQTPVIWRGPLVSRMTEQFFRDVEWGNLDIMLLDLPPGTGDVQLTLTQKIKMTGAVIITTPQDLALADVKKGADMFKKVNTPVLGVIENMSGLLINGRVSNPDVNIYIDEKNLEVDEQGYFNFKIDLFDKGGGEKESKRLGVPLIGKIPLSKNIVKASDSGMPIVLHEDKNESKIYYDIADKILSFVD